ncbi:DUF5694 domain-containing protein [Roseateles sp. DB2]|uniref:DUF5694 domain-containing protein n=1 Tax=Roseateles sp. DB2 TaxID=3453717 RepID=UPI003EEE0BBF
MTPKRIRILSLLATLLWLGGAQFAHAQQSGKPYQPAFQPSLLKGPPAGAANEVLVLGTPHLGEMEGVLSQDALQPLLQRLQRWQPQLIAVERLSGLQCDALRRQPARYADTVKSYCPEVAAAAASTGLDVIQANLEAERLLGNWPGQPAAAQRRHLAAVLLAAGEPVSALVQWLYLPLAERRAGEGLDEALVARLERLRTRISEDSWIAAPLAVGLGLQRVYSVDDHTADQPDPADPKAQEAAIRKAWDNEASRQRAAQDKALRAGLKEPGGLLKLYRACNAPDAPALAYRSDFGAALAEPSPQGYGRNYLGYWETRNLRMVAHVREVLGLHPGSRMLTVVGASHKGYYEAYLQQMHDVRLVDPMALLKD